VNCIPAKASKKKRSCWGVRTVLKMGSTVQIVVTKRHYPL